MFALIAIAAAFIVSALLTWRLLRPASRLHVLDIPNERSMHARPVPRTGGIGIVAGVATAIMALAVSQSVSAAFVWLLLSIFAVAAVSLWDDLRGLEPITRLLAHVGAAILLLVDGFLLTHVQLPGAYWALPPWLGVGLSLLILVWTTNLYNFMDGIDGLAGGMAVIGFGFLGIVALLAQAPLYASVNFAVAAAAGGFLLFNFPPARIFMGDVGSATLGLLVGAMSLWGAHIDAVPIWISLLIFSPFMVDATVTLIRRLWRRERVWQAHRTHYYQRLATRYGHRRATLIEYVVMLIMGTLALWAMGTSELAQALALAVAAIFYVVAGMWVERQVPLVAARSGG